MHSETRPNPDNGPSPEADSELASSKAGSGDDGSRLEELSREECVQLLATLPVGRLAVNGADGEGPHVVPVNYALDGETVVFSTDAGLKLVALRDQSVTFQVDLIDAFHRTGWSVMVHGIASSQQSTNTVTSWAGDHKPHTVRLEATTITGRRIRLPNIVIDSRGYL